MTEEALATLSFDHLRKGDRIQVNIHHPRIAALVNAGYLKIIWKEVPDAQVGDSDVDTVGIRDLRDAGLVAGVEVGEEAVTYGAGEDLPR